MIEIINEHDKERFVFDMFGEDHGSFKILLKEYIDWGREYRNKDTTIAFAYDPICNNYFAKANPFDYAELKLINAFLKKHPQFLRQKKHDEEYIFCMDYEDRSKILYSETVSSNEKAYLQRQIKENLNRMFMYAVNSKQDNSEDTPFEIVKGKDQYEL